VQQTKLISFLKKNNLQDYFLVLFSVFVFASSIKWVGSVFFGMYDLFNLCLLCLITILIGQKLQWKLPLKKSGLTFQFKLIPFVVTIVSIVLWSISHYVVVNILSASFFFTYLFGLYGLYCSKRKWLNSIAPFTLLLMTLPFGNMMDVYVGFPLRMMAIDSITSILNSLGLQNISSSTIITVENSATQIDFSCSGLKGIWASILFYFSITWIENLKINLNWLISFCLLITLILTANVFRIFIIISLSSIYELPQVAEVIHAPLGIIGFTFSCAITYFIIKSSLYKYELLNFSLGTFSATKAVNVTVTDKSYRWSTYMVFAFLVIALLIPEKHKEKQPKQFVSLEFPKNWNVTDLPLTNTETNFFAEQGSSATKLNFNKDSIQGSMLLLSSNGWRGHHNPEFCIRAGGNTINSIETIQITPELPIKWMTVNDQSSACFWFQSPTSTTDDFSTRIWSEVKNTETKWILTSVVFDNQINVNDLKFQQLITELNLLIQKYYTHE
jgi:exosortase O